MPAFSGYLALGTINPTTNVFAEITGGSYARQAVAFDPDVAANGGAVGTGEPTFRNNAAITFPAPTTADWPAVNAYAIYDAVSGGNLLMAWGLGSAARTIRLGRADTIPLGRIVLQFPGGSARSSHGTPLIFSVPFVATLGSLIPAVGLSATISGLTTTRALTADDNGKVLRADNVAALTLTVPASLPAGFNVAIARWGGGTVTIAAGSGATNRCGLTTVSKQYGLASILVTQNLGGAAAEFVLGGDAA